MFFWMVVAMLWMTVGQPGASCCRQLRIAGSSAVVWAMAAGQGPVLVVQMGAARHRRTGRTRPESSSSKWPAERRRSGWTIGACGWASLPIVTVPMAPNKASSKWLEPP